MRRWRRSWLVWLLALAILFVGFSFGVAAVVAEGALHPPLKRRPSDTAALAYSIAQSADARAVKVAFARVTVLVSMPGGSQPQTQTDAL